MAITERHRHQLFQRLEEILGVEEATTLMEHLPPVGWADVATKTDLDHLRSLTKGDIDNFRSLTKGDIDQLRTEVKGDIDQLRTEVKGDIDQLRTGFELKLEQELGRGIRGQTRILVLANLGYVTAFGSLVLAAAKL